MKALTAALLLSFVYLPNSALADVIVTDGAVVVQSDRAASRNNDDNDRDDSFQTDSNATVISPQQGVEGENQNNLQVLDNDDANDRARGNILIVPDGN